ncbi:short-chain dehydrogenase/reductase [Mollisia scopiformis]|uniref:Short-chain dehydrogenase/reductase n=1 Tax=Mollisia scopiformis TaxID=149040 RepID=A0A132B7G5_MOLSC|nr:short-chain dehydrogenase/reductase [Mollisia scopiformis]KUJ08352.1 short-chain dehydrogenase/reductase [Mollisia scopiformis]
MGFAGDIVQMNVGQILQSPFIPHVDLTGQTIVITGANTGLGFEAAKHFYKLNVSKLILACRNMTKGEAARKAVLASNPTFEGKVEVWPLDMSSFASVLAFGDRLNSLSRLDAFLSNAGIETNDYEQFEGHESVITVNVISTFLVSMLAIPKLRETAKAQKRPTRLVVTGSVMHIFAKYQHLVEPGRGRIFSSLDDEKTADMSGRYNLSKLMVLLGVRQLADQLDIGTKQGQGDVIVNCVNPGWCKTELFRMNTGGLGGKIGLALIGRSAEDGGKTLVHAAVAGKDTHGKYLDACRIKPESTWVRSKASIETERRMWLELVEILEAIRPGVTRL